MADDVSADLIEKAAQAIFHTYGQGDRDRSERIVRAVLAAVAPALRAEGATPAHCSTCSCGCTCGYTCGYGGHHEPANQRCALNERADRIEKEKHRD
jgi:hypothetical protein